MTESVPLTCYCLIIGRYWLAALLLLLAPPPVSFGQTPRLTDPNTLGWFVYSGDHRVAKKWAVHTEYQSRRVNWLRSPQYQLARLGLVHPLSERVQASAGYTYTMTGHPSAGMFEWDRSVRSWVAPIDDDAEPVIAMKGAIYG